MLYGVTHTPEGQPILRLPKACKVGIGNPKGKAIHVWIERSANGKTYWRVETGYGKEAVIKNFEQRADAEKFYFEALAKVGDCPFPRRIPYFTFLKPQADGTFTHDFDAIERHGPKPTAIDIVFLSNEPFKSAFQMWSASELKCIGDGRNAQRVLSMASTEEEKRMAAESKAAGAKMFPIIEGCFMYGCQYTKESVQNGKTVPPPCKIGTDLEFQLANDLRVGAKSFLHSTGFRTTAYLFSSIESVKMLTGGHLIGVPMKLVVRPFKAVHNGQPSTQYAIHVEFRAEDIQTIKQKLISQAFEFSRLAAAPVDMDPMQETRMLAAPATDDDDDQPMAAAHMTAEFYPAAVDEDEPGPAATPSAKAAEATAEATDSLKNRLRTAAEETPKAAEPAKVEAPVKEDPPPADPPKSKRRMPFA